MHLTEKHMPRTPLSLIFLSAGSGGGMPTLLLGPPLGKSCGSGLRSTP